MKKLLEQTGRKETSRPTKDGAKVLEMNLLFLWVKQSINKNSLENESISLNG